MLVLFLELGAPSQLGGIHFLLRVLPPLELFLMSVLDEISENHPIIDLLRGEQRRGRDRRPSG